MIAGAGVAGLTAALELAARGWTIKLFEKAAALSEVGAGLQLAPNAMRHLERLGVAKRLATQSVTPEALYLVDSRSARPLLTMELGDAVLKRWHHPYIVCHRADLQSALLAACLENPAIEINLGSEIVQHAVTGDGIRAQVRRGKRTETILAAYLLGCDGVWSSERAKTSHSKAQFSGHIAWRSTIAVDDLPASFADILPKTKAVSAWLGKQVHFVAYPVKNGDYFNFVAITGGENPGEGWSKRGDRERLNSIYRDWNPAIRDVIAASPEWTYWPLFQMPDTQFVCEGNVVLLGDASHAVTPFGAQGAAMAIEDAAALGAALDATDQQAGLAHFDSVRKERLAAVAKRGQLNKFAYHATGIFALGRNVMFAMRGPDRFLKDLDWLYGYDAVEAIDLK
ncbi:FAD dependent oxidoreductase family protein [Brucella thiophenivorans]|uniref:FAD dependent oxidoreductase family protein n=1 Tax=Brucella thiophenivorans TaxID=571255 RepID=A0A256FV95_9HYPH|nr:FAD dependent oxidoreductase family protein [Brucella thiophenivorans]